MLHNDSITKYILQRSARHNEELQAEVQAKNELITRKDREIATKNREIATKEQTCMVHFCFN